MKIHIYNNNKKFFAGIEKASSFKGLKGQTKKYNLKQL